MSWEFSVATQEIRNALRCFTFNEIDDLRCLVDRLDIIATQISGHDLQWDKEFRRYWGALEEVYAVVMAGDKTWPAVELQRVVHGAVKELKDLVGA
jgi:hypothetical protein